MNRDSRNTMIFKWLYGRLWYHMSVFRAFGRTFVYCSLRMTTNNELSSLILCGLCITNYIADWVSPLVAWFASLHCFSFAAPIILHKPICTIWQWRNLIPSCLSGLKNTICGGGGRYFRLLEEYQIWSKLGFCVEVFHKEEHVLNVPSWITKYRQKNNRMSRDVNNDALLL